MNKHMYACIISASLLVAPIYSHDIFTEIEKNWQTMEEQFNRDISNLEIFKHNLEYHIKDTINEDKTTNNVSCDIQDNKDTIIVTMNFDEPIKQDDIAITTQDNSLKGTITLQHGKVNLFISQHHDMITVDAQIDHHQELESKKTDDKKDTIQEATHIISSGVSRFERVLEGALSFDEVQADLDGTTLTITLDKKSTGKTVPVEITTNKHHAQHAQTVEKLEK